MSSGGKLFSLEEPIHQKENTFGLVSFSQTGPTAYVKRPVWLEGRFHRILSWVALNRGRLFNQGIKN
jgi:hypothetical protein